MEGLDILSLTRDEERVAQVHAFSVTVRRNRRIDYRGEAVVSIGGRSTGTDGRRNGPPSPADCQRIKALQGVSSTLSPSLRLTNTGVTLLIPDLADPFRAVSSVSRRTFSTRGNSSLAPCFGSRREKRGRERITETFAFRREENMDGRWSGNGRRDASYAGVKTHRRYKQRGTLNV